MIWETKELFFLSYHKDKQDIRVIDDPLGQTHNPASNDHYSRLNFVLFCGILKSGDRRTDNTCENSDHYQP